MRVELTEVICLDSSSELALNELAIQSGLSESELRELVDNGAIVPVDAEASQLSFHAETVAIARTACRLRRDFELDMQALALALTLLSRIRELETELHAQLARSPNPWH
jgi:chaperone modulatory protein CbpM